MGCDKAKKMINDLEGDLIILDGAPLMSDNHKRRSVSKRVSGNLYQMTTKPLKTNGGPYEIIWSGGLTFKQ